MTVYKTADKKVKVHLKPQLLLLLLFLVVVVSGGDLAMLAAVGLSFVVVVMVTW
jgi:hypothetical protein